MRSTSVIRAGLAAGVVALGLLGRATAGPTPLTLGEHGVLTLELPDGWHLERHGDGQGPPSFLLTPATGERFEVLLTALWPGGAGRLPDEAALRREVGDAAESARQQSIERTLPLEALTGPDVHGVYFRATDRAPKPGEYRYLAQGLARVGGIVLAFTVLSNDGAREAPRLALEMLRGARHAPPTGPGERT